LAGRLTIVGLGPARPEHVTAEALGVLQRARRDHARAYGLAHVRDLVETLSPGLEVRSLDYLYALEGVSRPRAYADLAQMLVRRAFTDGEDVIYMVAGSPLWINDAVLRIRRLCALAGHPLRLVHGMSFVDLVLDRVYWTGSAGLQLYSAWNVARDGIDLSVDAPALLCQLGEFSPGGEAVDMDGSQAMLQVLRERLLQSYPESHPVIILHSSGAPDYHSMGSRIPLSDLAAQPVPVYSNLWIPSLDGPELETLLAPSARGPS
jgi:uncharacterized protein YabN with tetrapyrrole methylase and pyrophosphatase domain